MKKTLALFTAVMLVLGMMSVGASATRGLVYTAPFGAAVIDGTMEDAWTAAEWTQIDLAHDGELSSDCTARARMMHDDALLYVIVEVTDATVADGNGDAFEIYFDEDNCKDVAYCELTTQLQMHLDGTVTAGANSQGMEDMIQEYKVAKSGSGYILEFSVKLQKGIPAADQKIGLEFMYNDADEDGAFLEALRWNADTANGDPAPWQTPESFGELVFAEYVEPAADAPAEAAPAEDGVAPAAPQTADAGIAVAAVVMAAAAAVVLSKKR